MFKCVHERVEDKTDIHLVDRHMSSGIPDRERDCHTEIGLHWRQPIPISLNHYDIIVDT